MKRFSKLFLVACLAFGLFACAPKEKGSSTIKGTYAIHVDGYDWGAGVSKATITLDYALDAVSEKDFIVQETKQATDFTDPTFPIKEVTVDRSVTKAYLTDDKGQPTTNPSKVVTLELAVSPNDGSPLLYSMGTGYNTWSDPYFLTITLNKDATLKSIGEEVKEFTVDTAFTKKTTAADSFKTSTFKATDGVEYKYAAYTPEEKSETLFVWLHGMGEGGTMKETDAYIPLLANKATAYASENFQKTVGNAHVLVPQCPTFWMDSKGDGGRSALVENDGTSFYSQSLKELIDSYKKEVGATKVVLAGCSNGGYMTLRMAIDHPTEFAAIVPICEALKDSFITDEELKGIKDLQMYFIYSKDDATVKPEEYEIPTIKRLKDLGATNLHVSTTDSVIDTSGTYKTPEGQPYQYNGHWSWIYFDNNESKCDECNKDSWSWIAENLK